MPKTKRRIDKKNAITFKVVSRSQHDPLVADERAPQHVLIQKDRSKQLEEQRKFGVYFDDEYNYLQHLKGVGEVKNELEPVEYKSKNVDKKKILLPSSVFESDVHEKEGLLNRAALPVGPQLDWDPEVVAAMDEDFDFDDPNNQIDDDFIGQAGGIKTNTDENEKTSDDDSDDEYSVSDEGNDADDDDDDEFFDSHLRKFSKEEGRSHFTNYSMTSSVIRRNEGLTLLDERFERLFEKEYGEDDDIGALDCEEIEGNLNVNKHPLLDQMMKEVADSRRRFQLDKQDRSTVYPIREEDDEEDENVIIALDDEWSKTQKEDRFDCETILSTYSNIYNHPKMIRENHANKKLKIDPKTGIPVGVLDKPGLTAKKLRELDSFNAQQECDNDIRSNYSRTSRVSELSMRPKNETKEERKERKTLYKEYKRERRFEKKANKMAFKLEEIRQNREIVNIKNNLNAIKLC